MEDIGHFKVIIEGEVDSKIEQKLESSIEKGATKGSEKAAKKIQENLKKAAIKSAEEFENKIIAMCEQPSFKNLLNIVRDTHISGLVMRTPSVPSKVEAPAEDVGKDIAGGAATGGEGVATGGKGAATGGLGAIMGLIAKIGVGIGAIMLIKKALDSLAPLQAMMKMLVAIIQITLYPIAQFFLSIFKPILTMLLKYLILPFYYKVMPVLEMLGKWIGETVAGILKDPVGAIQGLWKFVVDGTLIVLGALWESMKKIWGGIVDGVIAIFSGIAQILGAAFKVISDLFFDIGNFAVTVFSGMAQNIVNIFTFLTKTLLGVLNVLLSPFINLISRIIKNPLDAIGAFKDFGSEIANTGKRIGNFATEVQTNWQELQNKTLVIMNNIKDSGTQIFTNFGANMTNLFTIMNTVSGGILGEVVNSAISGFDVISVSFSNMVSSMKSAVSGVSYGREEVPSWVSPSIRAAIAEQGSVRYANPMAEGGIVNSPTMALIGESGPEAVIPLSKMGVMGGTTNITVNFHDTRVSNNSDMDDIVKKIERTFYTNSKRAGIR